MRWPPAEPRLLGGGRETAIQLMLIKHCLDSHQTEKAQQRDRGDNFIKKVIQVRFLFNLIE